MILRRKRKQRMKVPTRVFLQQPPQETGSFPAEWFWQAPDPQRFVLLTRICVTVDGANNGDGRILLSAVDSISHAVRGFLAVQDVHGLTLGGGVYAGGTTFEPPHPYFLRPNEMLDIEWDAYNGGNAPTIAQVTLEYYSQPYVDSPDSQVL